MDIKLPKAVNFEELGPMTCEYFDSILSGKSEEIELHIALSGNGYYLTIAGRSHGNRKVADHPPFISAIETAKKINEFLLVCGVDPDQLTPKVLLSFQKALYEQCGIEFFLGEKVNGRCALMGLNDKLLAAVFVQFDPKMVTE